MPAATIAAPPPATGTPMPEAWCHQPPTTVPAPTAGPAPGHSPARRQSSGVPARHTTAKTTWKAAGASAGEIGTLWMTGPRQLFHTCPQSHHRPRQRLTDHTAVVSVAAGYYGSARGKNTCSGVVQHPEHCLHRPVSHGLCRGGWFSSHWGGAIRLSCGSGARSMWPCSAWPCSTRPGRLFGEASPFAAGVRNALPLAVAMASPLKSRTTARLR